MDSSTVKASGKDGVTSASNCKELCKLYSRLQC